jgi:hypothetical protein
MSPFIYCVTAIIILIAIIIYLIYINYFNVIDVLTGNWVSTEAFSKKANIGMILFSIKPSKNGDYMCNLIITDANDQVIYSDNIKVIAKCNQKRIDRIQLDTKMFPTSKQSFIWKEFSSFIIDISLLEGLMIITGCKQNKRSKIIGTLTRTY